ncbi:redoxin family protein [Xanthomonas citri pv. citri]|uniref:Glutathione-dependent peroxiredoxin n=12 Tax=Xanthomonas TaxID=338 RepID=A0AAI8ES65_XANAC|nr:MULTISPECIES: peroxiredoxin [Xanthomonas]MBO9747352.1 peroxiredoxin [Xanthomonas phaseoli pv. dieffenbachiae]MBV6780505.1 peroxiredoxin [Xanthomonas campestris pv. trichodesmae]MBV6839046.1 peroxiredoxin [Xanthomonas campestris pv. merremiae]MEE5090024.1 peroxiredoxin [Xanthomonas euvesicatoria]OOW55809.1 peroxiredoxin [Xanthomonas campestris pv. centellae]OOW63230.1 peroxiredoxin [Xanthomonas campestris pv. thespesiae]OOW78261.1 peroxiredoxin [Xanthomonas campestris pv. leeana]OOW84635.
MTIHVGDRIPEVVLKRLRDGIEAVDTHSLFAGRKVLLFAVPGAFTPTCSAKHLPGYVEHFEQFRKRGIEVLCTAVNDPFVMQAWGRSQLIPDGLHLLPDGNAELARALGLEIDASGSGMGLRSRRYALYADDAVVKALFVEEPGEFKVSAADYVLQHLPD